MYIYMNTNGNILWVDRWTKYIGLAYRNEKSEMVMPVGYVMNDKSLFFEIGAILERYYIRQVVVGYPKQHSKAQEAIDGFLKNIEFINPDITCTKTDEEYSSVLASSKTQTWKKDEKEDTLAAVVILEDYMSKYMAPKQKK